MEYLYYFLNQAFSVEVWTEYDILVAYFCLALVLNSNFLT